MPVSRSRDRFRNVTNVSNLNRMREREAARRVGSGPIELKNVLFYDGKTCRYFPHEENNATNPGDAPPEDGDDGHSVAESELSVYPLVWPEDTQPSTRTSDLVGARGRTPGAVVKLKDIETIELEESIIIKLEEPDARPYAFSVSRSRSSTPQPTAHSSAPQPDPTTSLLPPGWIMCRWDMCREIVPKASLYHHVYFGRAHTNGNDIMRPSDGVTRDTHYLWDNCGRDPGRLPGHVRTTHFGDHVCNCCRTRFDEQRQLRSHLKKLCAGHCIQCPAVLPTRDDARVHYETRVSAVLPMRDDARVHHEMRVSTVLPTCNDTRARYEARICQDAESDLVTASTSSGPSLFRYLWAGCNAEVDPDDASMKKHLRFTHKVLTSTPYSEKCLWAGCTREVKCMRNHVMSQHVKPRFEK